MPVRIRLARWGARHCPFYGIVVANVRAPRDGRHLERIGTYNPVPDPETGAKYVELNCDRVKHWLGVGAQPSDRVAWLLEKAGLMPPRPLQLHREGKLSLSDVRSWDVMVNLPVGGMRSFPVHEARDRPELAAMPPADKARIPSNPPRMDPETHHVEAIKALRLDGGKAPRAPLTELEMLSVLQKFTGIHG